MSSEKIVVFGVAILRNASLRISSSYFRYSLVTRNASVVKMGYQFWRQVLALQQLNGRWSLVWIVFQDPSDQVNLVGMFVNEIWWELWDFFAQVFEHLHPTC
jgi:hypothetical protein